MTIHGKFIGRLIRKPESAGPKKYGFTLMALTLDDSDVEGANEVHALLDPKVLDKPETSKDSRKWDAGDLVQLEGEVVKIGICKCCAIHCLLLTPSNAIGCRRWCDDRQYNSI